VRGRQYYRGVVAATLTTVAFLLAFSPSGEAYIVTGGVPPQFGPAPGEGNTQYSSGVFEYSKVDLTIPAPMPIKIVRTYRSEDKNPQGQFNNRGFGLGTTINYDIYLYSSAEVNNQANPYSTIDLITADGGRIVFQCAPGANCSTYTSAVLVSNSQPIGPWFGAVLSYNASVPGWDVTLKDGTVYVFGQGAPLQSITDRYNNSISIGRSGTNITGISASNGRSVGFTYTGSNITKITDTSDSNGETVTYAYNTSHALTSVKYNYNYDGYSFLLGGEVEYSYDPTYLGDITQFQVGVTTDDNQTVATWATPVNVSYDSSRRMNKVISLGASSGYTYLYTLDPTHSFIQTSTITLPDSVQRTLTFDAHGYTINDQRGTGGSAETTAITRYSDELIQEINENNLRTTSFIYDSYGNATSVTRSPGPGTLSSITATALYQQPFNELESVTDPLNNTSTFFYDSEGSLITAKDPLQRATSLTHNAAGQLATIADPLMNTTHIGYTAAGDLASYQDPAGTLTQYVYDFNKLNSTMEPSNGFDQTTYYDGFGHIKSSQDGDVNTTGWTYDLMGHVTSMTDAAGHVTSIAPTTGSNGVSLCDASMQCAYSYYDNASKLTSTVDKRGLTTTYTYDSLDRLSVNCQFNEHLSLRKARIHLWLRLTESGHLTHGFVHWPDHQFYL
jgi:YD repeat-containing protein